VNAEPADDPVVVEERAEIVAHVWKVLVANGQTVDEGQTLAVLESMKMEIPVCAGASGRIIELLADEGQIVQEGDVLVRIAH